MDEPLHYQESLFWDRVTDWLLATPEAALDSKTIAPAHDDGEEPPAKQ